MASLSRKGSSRPTPAMNVTPLVDVVLVLLIIFMVVIPAMDKGLDVEVPAIVHPDLAQESAVDPFLLSVTHDGTMYFENTPMDPEHLESFLREANRREPQRKIVLRGDRSVHYARVRALLALCRDIGFPGVSLRVNHRGGDDNGAG